MYNNLGIVWVNVGLCLLSVKSKIQMQNLKLKDILWICDIS